MKSKKELLTEILEENKKTQYVKEVDLEYHKEVLIPRYMKEKDKKVREQKVANGKQEMDMIEVLIEDIKKLDKMIKAKLDKCK